MKKLYAFLIAFAFAFGTYAQVTETDADLKEIHKEEVKSGWKTGGLFSVGFNQVSLTNWAAGGQNSISGNGLMNVFAAYGKGSLSWENTLDMGYGMMKQGKEDLIKTDDKIDFMSKFGLKAFDNWHYAGLLNFKTQMTPGYNYPNTTDKISDLLAPAYLLLAVGMDYKAFENFSLFIAPVTGKITIVNDDVLSQAGAFGVEPGETIKSEFGGYIRTSYKINITDDISFQTKLDLFSNYLDKPQNLDVNWETLTMIKVSKYITVSFATHLIYDENIMIGVDTTGDGEVDTIGPRTQFKQLLGVGLSFKI
ncbi:MAG: DUF3078 domain-containing protein [Bacteroidetes bacterium]|nr:DUF3078 domain-containing protein [Bacteroidota bacterium]